MPGQYSRACGLSIPNALSVPYTPANPGNWTPPVPDNVGTALDDLASGAALTLGNLTESVSNVLTITNGTNAVFGSGTTIQMKQASVSQSGYLSAADYNMFVAGLAGSNLDGGLPSSTYGGVPAINGGAP